MCQKMQSPLTTSYVAALMDGTAELLKDIGCCRIEHAILMVAIRHDLHLLARKLRAQESFAPATEPSIN